RPLLSRIGLSPTQTYSLSLHDALPICPRHRRCPDGPVCAGARPVARATRDRIARALSVATGPVCHRAGRARPGAGGASGVRRERSEEHTSELQSLTNLVCRLLLANKKP